MKKSWLTWIFLLLLLLGGCSSPETATAPSGDQPETAVTEENAGQNSEWQEEMPGLLGDPAFEIHFFDVGQADSSLVICDGFTLLIDGGNAADGDDVVASLTKLGINRLDAVVVTHSDEDHVGGIPDILRAFPVGTLYATSYGSDSRIYREFLETAAEKQLSLTAPTVNTSFSLGKSVVTFLGPVQEASNPNNSSVVLRIDYGENAFLFTGDAMRAEEESLLAANADLHADVLKIGHHGGEESSSYVFLREIMPTYAVISVGEGNQYGHPTEAVLSRLRDAGTTVYRTDIQGEITCISNGKDISFTAARYDVLPTVEENREEKETVAPEEAYIGNINSMKFHNAHCSYLPDAENSVYFATRDEALAQGYEPCGRCQP